MNSSIKKSFRDRLAALPPDVRRLAYKNFRLWRDDSEHPSLHFKKVGRYWSVRIGRSYRALAVETDNGYEWFWIGAHGEYDRLIKE